MTLSSSSIGATVNIEYPKPFDHPGMRFVRECLRIRAGRGRLDTADAAAYCSATRSRTTRWVSWSTRSTASARPIPIGVRVGLGRRRFAPCQLTPTCSADDLDDAERTSSAGGSSNTAPNSHRSRTSASTAASHFSGGPPTKAAHDRRQLLAPERRDGNLWLRPLVRLERSPQRALDDNGTVVDYLRPARRWISTAASTTAAADQPDRRQLQIRCSDNLSFDVDASYAKSEHNPNGRGFDGADIGYGGTLGCNMGVRVLGDSCDTCRR